ncbi:MAG TPA: hypothetical protein DCY79_20450 [Planctomycetaceae bacterium]|nr:hypothetical protein [Blastopirellula sp.]HAY82183.1 hypothetical protein [Planctomycetaceae bacterium]
MSSLRLTCACVLLLFPVATVSGQIGTGIGGGVGRGVRGLSTAQGGWQQSPSVQPAASLTPGEVLYPRGSLRPAEVRYPRASFFRPQVSGSPSANRQRVLAGAGSPHVRTFSEQQRRRDELVSERSRLVGSSTRQERIQPPTGSVEARRAVLRKLASPTERRYVELQFAFMQLERQLGGHTNGKAWAAYLALPKEWHRSRSPLRTAAASKLLARFEKVASQPEYALVASLPEFPLAHAALKEFTAGWVAEQSLLQTVQAVGPTHSWGHLVESLPVASRLTSDAVDCEPGQ